MRRPSAGGLTAGSGGSVGAFGAEGVDASGAAAALTTASRVGFGLDGSRNRISMSPLGVAMITRSSAIRWMAPPATMSPTEKPATRLVVGSSIKARPFAPSTTTPWSTRLDDDTGALVVGADLPARCGSNRFPSTISGDAAVSRPLERLLGDANDARGGEMRGAGTGGTWRRVTTMPIPSRTLVRPRAVSSAMSRRREGPMARQHARRRDLRSGSWAWEAAIATRSVSSVDYANVTER